MGTEVASQQEYKVWDRPSRIFHWINAFLVFLLSFIGCIMLFKSELGITGLEAKIKLKALHIVIGYVFVINLLLRFIWFFWGNQYTRWRGLFLKKNELKQFFASMGHHTPQQYIGHNPLGKIAVILMLFTLSIIAVTGLVRAGTDLYYPPLGAGIQVYLAQDDVDSASIKPYDKTGVSEQRYLAMMPYKKLAGKVHLYSVYFLFFLIFLHITGVVYAELTHQPGIVSAMISGIKYFKN